MGRGRRSDMGASRRSSVARRTTMRVEQISGNRYGILSRASTRKDEVGARREMKEARNHYHTQGSSRGGGGTAAKRDLMLQWGNRKRLRCVKVQRRNEAAEKAAISQRRNEAAATHHHPTGHTHQHHRVLSMIALF
uniref:Uncharacterized protein n=1 Tax=Zea mays TaxID=4577 RepID=A0A804PYU2_MAIZE